MSKVEKKDDSIGTAQASQINTEEDGNLPGVSQIIDRGISQEPADETDRSRDASVNQVSG